MNVFILEFRWQSLRQWQFVGFVGSTPETWFWSELWLHSARGSLKKQTDTILLLLKPWKRCEPKNPGMSLPNFKTTRRIAIIAGKKWATAINLPFISIYPWLGMVTTARFLPGMHCEPFGGRDTQAKRCHPPDRKGPYRDLSAVLFLGHDNNIIHYNPFPGVYRLY